MKSEELRQFAVLGGLLVLVAAGALTAVATPAPHPGGDNAGYLSLAYGLVEGYGYVELWEPGTPNHTKYPPGLPLLLGGLMWLGASSWMAFKLLQAVCVSAAVLLAFAWTARRSGPIVGLAVALATLLSAGWLDASRWILSEPSFLVWTFLALWAAEHALEGKGAPQERTADTGWLVLAGAAAILAFFTRSAGLPLILALFAALLLARRIRPAGILAGVLALPAAWWWLRARRGGEGAYQAEFWMVNPYEPGLGLVGWLDLPARAWINLSLYVGDILPGEWWGGAEGALLAALGIVLVGLAVWGWVRNLRPRPGTAELFVPLYLGLILLWPEVWSGDRFILPLYPFLLLYAGEALHRVGCLRGPAAGKAAVAGGVLLLVGPALPGWVAMASEAGDCRRIAEAQGDVFSCHGEGFRQFRDAAAWSGENLPPDAVVLNRKPRIQYVLAGRRGRTYPFSHDPDVLLAEADRLGARYLLMDHVDGISLHYLPAVIRARPLAFCYVRGWGTDAGGMGTDLFGILPPEERRSGGDVSELGWCPEGYAPSTPVEPDPEGRRVPLLMTGGVGRD